MIHDLNARLIGMRFTSVEAEMGPGSHSKQAGGSIGSEVKMSLSDLVDGKNTATVTIDAKGIPQGATESDFAFRIAITGIALWEWSGDMPSPELLQQDATIYELCYAIHTLIVGEVTRLALGLGFPGVTLSWNPRPEPEPKVQKKPRASTPRTKKTPAAAAKV
ncbi:hypothetical protein [Accumulibacter sp.]|uniref:Uncharacterized protein n=1 Tax=Candidatus Accumulibacter proximus TaxID=2954385 RepID=A0A935UG41_9PROT|nr:hypothetical protein [Accumulibacter sp.]MBK7674048.1 hypothetical protein [Candidatus Accumulibacter proximus]MBL8375294.1 hypothetical protein [Accumulibacter sp.]